MRIAFNVVLLFSSLNTKIKMADLLWEPSSGFCFPSGPAAVSVVYRSQQEKNWNCVAIC